MLSKETTKYDLLLHQCLDITLKEGHSLSSALIDEKKYLTTLFFLKNSRVYTINIPTKKLTELDFTKTHETIYITTNDSNDYLICIFKSGRIFAIDFYDNNIIYFKNIFNNTEKLENSFKLYANSSLDKVVVYTSNQIIVWYSSVTKYKTSATNISNIKGNIKELLGFHIYIQLKEERKSVANTQEKNYKDAFNCFFGNNYFLGSHLRLVYVLLLPQVNLKNTYKLVLIVYLFLFDKETKFRAIDMKGDNEYKNKFYSKYLFTYLIVLPEIEKKRYNSEKDNNSNNNKETSSSFNSRKINNQNLSPGSSNNSNSNYSGNPTQQQPHKKTLVTRASTTGTIIAIGINFNNEKTSYIVLFYTEVNRFTSYRTSYFVNIYNNMKPASSNTNSNNNTNNNMINNKQLIIEDIAFICNDAYIVILFAGGFFTVINQNFQCVQFHEVLNHVVRFEYSNNLYYPKLFAEIGHNKLFLQRIRIIPSIKYSDYFVLYTGNIIIGFQCSNKNYIEKRIQNEIQTFEDFIDDLVYFQLSSFDDETKREIFFEKINNYIVLSFSDIFTRRENDSIFQSENINTIIKSFVNFLIIYRTLKSIHEDNFMILIYFLNISSNFFSYLLRLKEIWLAYLFIEITETYLLSLFKLKNIKNKKGKMNTYSNNSTMKKTLNETTYVLFNPSQMSNSNLSLKCYNKITNYTIFSKYRLILLFYALIEFRNTQALNINVLYYVLAKVACKKLQQNNLLDDIHFILRIIIRNWRYLKNENLKAGGEEYVLNGFTMNYRTELMSQFLHSKTRKYDSIMQREFDIDFIGEFYTLDEIQNLLSTSEGYCYGEEENLIDEYGYVNNIGVIQKWILLLNNYFFEEFLIDIKKYVINHLDQTINNILRKKDENIPPEEKNLAKLVYFNVFLMNLFLYRLINKFISSIINNSFQNNENSLSQFSIEFVSPVDIPFLLYELYSNETNEDNIILNNDAKTKEALITNLNEIITRYERITIFNLSIMFDFSELLMNKGFKYYCKDINEIETKLIEINQNNPSQQCMFTFLQYQLILIHKVLWFSLIYDNSIDVFNTIVNYALYLETIFKKEIIELALLLLNGYLRFFLIQPKRNNIIKIIKKIILNIKYITHIILSFEQNDEYIIRTILSEYIGIVPQCYQFVIMENSLYFEWKYFIHNFKKDIFSFNDVSSFENLNKNIKVQNIFETLISNSPSNIIYDSLFITNHSNKEKFSLSLQNITTILFKHMPSFILESNQSKINNLYSSKTLPFTIIDKLISGNINNYKTIYKDLPYTTDILLHMKILILKIINFFNILYVKYKILTINPLQDTLNYIKLFAFCLIFEEDYSLYMTHHNTLLYYLSNAIDLNEVIQNESKLKKLNDILLFIKISFICNNITSTQSYDELEKKINTYNNSTIINKYISSNMNILLKYLNPINNATCYNQICNMSKEMKRIMICLGNTFYMKISSVVISQLTTFNKIINANENVIHMKFAREKYATLCKCFYILTGINIKSQFTFDNNWELKHEHELFSLIISDTHAHSKQYETYFDKETYECILSERQMKCLLRPVINPESKINMRIMKLLNHKKSKKRDYNEVKVVQNENEDNNEKDIHIRQEKKKKYRIILTKKEINENDVNSNEIINKSYKPIEKLVIIIKKVFFYKLVNELFYRFKKEISGKELEEIQIINVIPKDGIVNFSKLKEKFISTIDLSKLQKNEYNNLSQLKHFDLISVNKYKPGKSENSKIFQELVSYKKTKRLNETIKSKLDEFKDKINHFEGIIKSLSDDFNSKSKKP